MSANIIMKCLCLLMLLGVDKVYAKPVEVRIASRDGMPQVLIPAGAFTMGATDKDAFGRTAEAPPHSVILDAYWMDQHEVTNEQFVRFLNAATQGVRSMIYNYCDPSSAFCRITVDVASGKCAVEPGFEQHPVCAVSWEGARAYAQFVRRRLPSEAEWEKAARGSDGRRYPWGEVWLPANLNTVEKGPGRTSAVGAIAGDRSPYNIWDMGGNVREWVQDTWEENYYLRSPLHNPVCTAANSRRVNRGGAWCLTEWDARTTSRNMLGASSTRRYMGFRCAEDSLPPLSPAPDVPKSVRFYAPMDGSVHAAFARGERRALAASNDIVFVKGHCGQAALLGENKTTRFSVDYDSVENLNLQEGTLALWIQPQGWNGAQEGARFFFMIRDEARCRFHLYKTATKTLALLTGNGVYQEWGGIYTSVEDWQDGEWRHLAVTWTPDRTVTLYMNGKLRGKMVVAPEKYFKGLPAHFSIGQSQSWGSDVPRAQTAIDEVMIFDRALGQDEIVELTKQGNF